MPQTSQKSLSFTPEGRFSRYKSIHDAASTMRDPNSFAKIRALDLPILPTTEQYRIGKIQSHASQHRIYDWNRIQEAIERAI